MGRESLAGKIVAEAMASDIVPHRQHTLNGRHRQRTFSALVVKLSTAERLDGCALGGWAVRQASPSPVRALSRQPPASPNACVFC